jgi:hypothetical protein
MADVKNVMGVSADDIKSIMGVAVDDIKTVVGLDWPASGIAWAGGRHVLAGNSVTVGKREIDYKSSTSNGDTADWGDLIYGGSSPRGTGTGVSSTKGLVGSRYGISTNIDDYDVLTIASTGTIADGGDLVPDAVSGYGMSNGTLMFFAGGSTSGGYIADMDYITIASLGGSTDAGDITTALRKGGSCSGDTRGGRFGGSTGLSGDGYANYTTNTADYITFHTTNDASDFGDLSNKEFVSSACASTTRWVHKTSNDYTNATGHILYERMDFWAADTGGTAGDFGDITGVTRGTSAMADGTRGEFWGGEDDADNIIDQIAYITIASAGDATDAGNLGNGINKAEAAGLSGSA